MAWGILIVWLTTAVIGFWYYQYRPLQPFSLEPNALITFQGEPLEQWLADHPLPTSEGQITLIHYWDDSCRCSRFNTPHLARLIERFRGQAITFILQPVGTTPSNLTTAAELQQLAPTQVRSVSESFGGWRPPAIPSVVVLDRDGQLAYLGPYSPDALCSENQSLLETLLPLLLSGQKLRQRLTNAFGCFCTAHPTGTH